MSAMTVKAEKSTVLATLHPSLQDKSGSPMAIVTSYGKGTLGVIGMNIGDEKDINVKFPEEYHAENLFLR